MKTRQPFFIWKSGVLCLFAALALSIRFPMPPEAQWMTGIEEIICNFSCSIQNYTYTSLLYVLLLFADYAVERKTTKKNPAYGIAGFVIALIWLMSEGFRIDHSFSQLKASAGQLVKDGIYVAGYTYLLTRLFELLEWLLYEYSGSVLAQTAQRRLVFGKTFLLFLICWMPHWLLAYPGNTCADSISQFRQYFGLEPFTAHHPPAHTLLIGGLVQLGHWLGKAEWGLYAIVLLQTVTAAAVLAYACLLLEHLHAPKWLKGLFFLVSLLSPYHCAYIGTVLKDVLYSYGFLLYVIELVYLLTMGMDYFQNRRHVLLLNAAVLMVYLFRNNGAYVLWGTLPLLLLFIIFQKHETALRKGKAAFLTILPLLVSILIIGVVEETYQIQPGSIKEALSLPFQQTARYVKEHDDEVTPDEREAIDAVLHYDRLARRYNPLISDPVKEMMAEKDPSSSDLLRYVKTWISQFFKHPVTYVQATLNQNYFLFYPFEPNSIVYIDTADAEWGELSIERAEKLVPAKKTLGQIYQLLFSLPVIGLLSTPAFYVLVLIAQCMYALRRKAFSLGILLWPAILSVLVVLLAPAVYQHPRYVFPVIFSMPVLLAYEVYLGRCRQSR